MALKMDNVHLKAVKHRKHRFKLTKWGFVLPAAICVLLLTIFPLIYSLSSSFRNIYPMQQDKPFVGLKNFSEVLRDYDFLHSLLMTLAISVCAVVIELMIGMIVAVCTSQIRRGRAIVVALSLLPVFMVPVVIGYMWRYLLAAQFGPVNQILGWILQREIQFDWLNTKVGSFTGVVMADVWQWSPFMFLVLFAGMSNVLPEIYEASSVDGCSPWQTFKNITLPLIKPALLIAVTIRAVDTLKIFDTVWSMTQGGPGTFSQTMSMNIYLLGFQQFRLGYASAASYIVMIISILVASILISILSRDGRGGMKNA